MQFLMRNWRLPLVFGLASGLSACGSGVNTTGTGTPTATGLSTSTASSPAVAISSTPAQLTPGQSATLTWNSTNATACSGSGAWAGTISTSGTKSTGPLKTTAKYMLTCSGTGGSTTQTATVTVNAAPSTGSTAPTVTISADPSIVSSGGSTTLTWTSTGATACAASGAWSGTEAVSGTRSTGALSADTTYTLNCNGPGEAPSNRQRSQSARRRFSMFRFKWPADFEGEHSALCRNFSLSDVLRCHWHNGYIRYW